MHRELETQSFYLPGDFQTINIKESVKSQVREGILQASSMVRMAILKA
jgi:hypothetical protein